MKKLQTVEEYIQGIEKMGYTEASRIWGRSKTDSREYKWYQKGVGLKAEAIFVTRGYEAEAVYYPPSNDSQKQVTRVKLTYQEEVKA